MKITPILGAIDQEKIALNTSMDFLMRVWMGFRNAVGVETEFFKSSRISRAISH